MQPPLDLPAMEYAERSDPGRDPAKQVNEDVCGRRETRFGHLCVVCDGMGGHAAGREAAELALSTIFEVFDQAPPGVAAADVLRTAIEEASRRIHTMPTSEAALGRPGSTVVAVLMHAHGTEVAHVGDSRAYLVHEGQIFRVTRDHSIVQEMVDRGLLTPQQAAHHPDANRITRALGMAPEVVADVRPQPIFHVTGDTFVLCSDGLSDLVVDHEILDDRRQRAAGAGGEPARRPRERSRRARQHHRRHPARADDRARASVRGRADRGADERARGTRRSPPRARRSSNRRASGRPRFPRSRFPFARSSRRSPPAPTRVRRPSPLVVAGLALASLAIVLLAVALASHFADRAGKSNAPASAEPAIGAAAPADALAPTPLLPESVVLPSESAPPGEPIAPLEPPVPDAVHGPRKAHPPRDKEKR